jgi:membrane protease YdiL (CAAX protease family)
MTGPTAATRRRCRRCLADILPETKYCGQCGTPTPAHVQERLAAFGATQRPARAAVGAMAAVVGGVLLSIVAGAGLAHFGAPVFVAVAVQFGLFVVAGIVALRIMGASLASALVIPRAWRPWIEAVAAGVAGFGVSAAYVMLLVRVLAPSDPLELDRDVPELVAGILLAPVIEEWLCRGVLWAACRRVSGVVGTVFVTAVVFAILHGLNGLSLLEMPHRFVSGLIFGWVRWRTRSVVPCIAAHALHNALAYAVLS